MLANAAKFLIVWAFSSLLLFGQSLDKDAPIFRQGAYKGQPVDTSIWLHAQEVSEAQQRQLQAHIPQNLVGEYHFFKNLRHRNEWHVAAVPKQVESVALILSNIAKNTKIAHGFTSFSFQLPVILFPVDNPNKVEKIYDIIVSHDAARPVGGKFSALDGFRSYNILHTNFTSLWQVQPDYNLSDPAKRQQVFEFALVDIPAEVKNRLLAHSIELSMNGGYSRIYNTLSTNNCCGQLFQAIDYAMPPTTIFDSCRRDLNHIATFLPGLFRDALRARGLYNSAYERLLVESSRYQKAIAQ